MADVKEFELFHGIVLTKLVRSDRPTTLRLIETDPSRAWAAYTVNDEVTLYVKYRASSRTLSRAEGGRSWNFVFSASELAKIRAMAPDTRVHLALVCGQKKIESGDCGMHVCFLTPDHRKQLIETKSTTQQTISVKCLPGKSLRVTGSVSHKEHVVKRSALDKWTVPGT